MKARAIELRNFACPNLFRVKLLLGCFPAVVAEGKTSVIEALVFLFSYSRAVVHKGRFACSSVLVNGN